MRQQALLSDRLIFGSLNFSQNFGERKVDVFLPCDDRFDVRIELFFDPIDTFLDNDFWCTGSGRYHHRFHPVEPVGVDIGDAINQI